MLSDLYFILPMQQAFFQNILLKIQTASYPLLCVYIHKRCFIFYTGKTNCRLFPNLLSLPHFFASMRKQVGPQSRELGCL
jgi:hypothetical protein